MPKDENIKLENGNNEFETVEEKVPETIYSNRKPHMNGRPYFIAGIVIVILLILALIGGMFRLSNLEQSFGHRGMTIIDHQNMPMMRSSSFFSRTNNDGTTTSTSTYSVSGVVTAVDGSSFDIGGNGTKTTVNTTGSTTFNNNDKKVVVNDSVIVTGTKSDDKINATDVQIVNF